jgi:hypothetical protein
MAPPELTIQIAVGPLAKQRQAIAIALIRVAYWLVRLGMRVEE